MLAQNPRSMFTGDTLWEELLESADGDEMRAGEMLEMLELSNAKNTHPYDLSGGEMQRAAMGKLLLRQGSVLLLDEPAKGLDAYGKHRLGRILRSLTDKGISILTVTHDVEFAAEYAHRCGLMFDGEILSRQEPHRFFAGNRFYTTSAHRIGGAYFPDSITCSEVISSCKKALSANEPHVQP